MILPPNAVFDLYRDVVDDGYGNETDDNTAALYTGLRGVLSYKQRIVKDPITGTPQQQQFYFCLMPKDSDVLNGDRLHRTDTGEWFNVDGVNSLPAYGFASDLNVTLSRTGG